MTFAQGGGNGPVPGPRQAASVLADRMAAALLHREPGWRLPRRSALARRYNVSLTELDAAIAELAGRSLLRRMPDGQLYRASPAEYRIPLEGVGGLATRLDPMGNAISCRARHVSRRQAPQDIGWSLGLVPGAPVRIIRCLWVCGDDPAAISTVYLPEQYLPEQRLPEQQPHEQGDASQSAEEPDRGLSFDDVLNTLPVADAPFPEALTPEALSSEALTPEARPAVLHVEMRAPQPSAARSLRLTPGQAVLTVTIRFDDPAAGRPAGLAVVMLKPDLFRVSVETVPTQISRAPLAGALVPGPFVLALCKLLDTRGPLLGPLTRCRPMR
jgi:DNA-binding GntR family transcriptional regulator